ncbi:MAG: hypothetical protein HQL28_06650 [Candidatus Omnitrophica bacterium]|nr:hypothetical protein [Candidatus Omnitrophota bacterium]
MIGEKEMTAIRKLAEKYKIKRVLLFGSCLRDGKGHHDIDMAVEGLKKSEFFNFYGEMMFSLEKPVDIVDLSSDSKFNTLIREEGLLIYG